MDVARVQELVRRRVLRDLASVSAERLSKYERFLRNPEIRDYLMHCLPPIGYEASRIRVKSLELLDEENLGDAMPGSLLFAFGYLVVATSIGGNAICFHDTSGGVFWAETSAFCDGEISFYNREADEWFESPMTAESIPQALVLLSSDIGQFLIDLLQDRLTERLDHLD